MTSILGLLTIFRSKANLTAGWSGSV